jgi:hypothetical protein
MCVSKVLVNSDFPWEEGLTMLKIKEEGVQAVLLHDGWHTIHDRSFGITGRCVIGETKIAGKVPEWQMVATWKEVISGKEAIASVTVRFDSILGLREE